MVHARPTIVLVLVLALLPAAGAETTDSNGVGIGTDRDSAMAYLAEVQERRARLQALRHLRRSLERFGDAAVARAEGYAASHVCLASSDGGLGVPFTRPGAPVSPDELHTAPHVLTYEPRDDGTLALVGAQFAVLRDAWHEAGRHERPSFLGEPFALVDHLFDEPAYVLFVWLTEPNPAGTFAAWHPAVRCGQELHADDDTGAWVAPAAW